MFTIPKSDSWETNIKIIANKILGIQFFENVDEDSNNTMIKNNEEMEQKSNQHLSHQIHVQSNLSNYQINFHNV
jgi:hypothetical protein